jgi:hypothetical protein
MNLFTNFPNATPETVWASMQETDRIMKELQKTVGGWANNHGFFAEEYFVNSFKKGQRNFFGEKFDRLIDHAKGIKDEDEYDILLINGKSVGIVEIKFKAHIKDIPAILRKAQTFRENFPEFSNHQVYLGFLEFLPRIRTRMYYARHCHYKTSRRYGSN